MTNSATQRHENGGASDGSYLPDASTTMTGDRTDPGPGRLVFVPDADGINGSWYLESRPNSPTPDYHESNDRPLFSDANEPDYWDNNSSTPRPDPREVADQPDYSGVMVDESGNFRNDSNAITHGNNHMIDQHSFLSDAVDADNSGTFQTYLNTSKVDHQPVINPSFSPHASDLSNTTIEMESSQTSETGLGPHLPNVSETDNPGSLTGSTNLSEVGGNNNLFFRTEDGRVLAVRISPALGPELLRGLSQQSGPLTQLLALPFASTPSTNLDDGAVSNAQNVPSTEHASAQPSPSASRPSRTASVSSNTSAPARDASAALASTLCPNSDAGVINADAWVDRIFSSADGRPYDRDWISNHNVSDDILKGDSSKHKLDLLFRHGAVIPGDKLCVTYRSSGNPVIIEGEVLPDSTSTNICVRFAPARAGFDGVLRTIQGPKDLIVGMNEEYAGRYDQAVKQQWKAVRLTSSTGHDFGTLFEVRQAYQVWADEKAKWAVRNSQAAV